MPRIAAGLERGLHQVTSTSYRRPGALPEGGVLVVGASATGAQIAEELRGAGRDVVLAVGRHRRLPRRYRGRDIMWWQTQLGRFDTTIDEVADPAMARHEPSGQLVGRPGYDLDLARLEAAGVELAGRLVAVDGGRVRFAADLAAHMREADDRLGVLLDDVDRYIERHRLDGVVSARRRPEPFVTDGPDVVDLVARGITTVMWATGFERSYPWLHVPVLDARGEITQVRGVTPVEGLYTVGQRFQVRRGSDFISGVGRDAREIVDRIVARSRGPAEAVDRGVRAC